MEFNLAVQNNGFPKTVMQDYSVQTYKLSIFEFKAAPALHQPCVMYGLCIWVKNIRFQQQEHSEFKNKMTGLSLYILLLSGEKFVQHHF